MNDMKPAIKWIVMVFIVVAFVLSLWLTIQKWTGKIESLAGCGAGSGCANVLGSKWSMVGGVIPVSVFSCLLYLALVMALWARGAWSAWLRSLLAWILLAAACWFVGLQLFVVRIICPYCMVMHGLGITIGLLVLWFRPVKQDLRRSWLVTLLPAILLVSALALIQHFGPSPETHRLAVSSPPQEKQVEASTAGIHASGDGREVWFLDNTKSFRIEHLPHIGGADAQHVLVKYFDYTCEACLSMHEYLDELMTKYPGELAVIVLPVPLERACNPHIPQGVKDRANACRLAVLSLRVWQADPDQFAEFHRALFDCRDQPYEVAEALAYSLVDPARLEGSDKDWAKALLEQNIADYASFVHETPVMPKLMIKGNLILHGKTKDADALDLLLQEQLGVGRAH
ncbi:MAG: vitamin K epoxide reductase family protein [Akkermansiaceae bacterium]